MGQYWNIVNVDKKQLLHPHAFGEGLKLGEFGCSGSGSMTALSLLIVAPSCGDGGGDYMEEHPLLGSWYGNRIAIIGDYTDDEDLPQGLASMNEVEDISLPVLEMMLQDDNYAICFLRSIGYIYWNKTIPLIKKALERKAVSTFLDVETLNHIYGLVGN